MTISTFAELQSEVIDWSYRTDLDSRIPNFIALCESDMQVRCKLVDFESSATVTLADGVGALPSGFTGMRAVYWNGDVTKPLKYVTPDRYDALQNETGDGVFYTLTGSSIKVSPPGDGDVVMTYKARFTPLSNTNTTNVLLTNYPDAYLHGTLLQLRTFCKDRKGMADELGLYEAAVKRIEIDNNQRKYAGATLEVKPR